MTLRLADIGARIAGIQQLGGVVNAMRGIAASRAQQARAQLGAVDSYATVIEQGIGRALALLPLIDQPVTTERRVAIVVFVAEQGFAGAFSERVLDFVGKELATAALFVVGTRGCSVLETRGFAAKWSAALPSHSSGIPRLADELSEALYAKVALGEINQLDVVFVKSEPGHFPQALRQTLLPIASEGFSVQKAAVPALLNLAPRALLADLTADYIVAQLCHAALHAFASENEARMEAMAAARDQVASQLAKLRSSARQVRQDDITAEVIELSAGAAANRS